MPKKGVTRSEKVRVLLFARACFVHLVRLRSGSHLPAFKARNKQSAPSHMLVVVAVLGGPSHPSIRSGS
jgi:hypothetical protein